MSGLSLPAAIRRVILDVGANTDPLLPPADDAGALTLAFEPITFGAIAPAPGRLHVLPVAVAGFSGLATMRLYNQRDRMQSSSLSASRTGLSKHGERVVPVLALASLLQAVPPNVTIELLKTDIQGHDFATLSSVDASTLRRAPFIRAEVWLGARQNYVGVRNDLCRDFLPHLSALGYELLAVVRFDGVLVTRQGKSERYCARQEQRKGAGAGAAGSWTDEADSYWRLASSRHLTPPRVGWDFATPALHSHRHRGRRPSRGTRETVSAAAWLQGAADGHCGVTRDEGDCRAGDRGAWRLSPFGSETWESAASECLGHCAACARCRVISIGLQLHDCSWYSSCALGAQLTLQPAGFRSASAWPGAS